MTDAATTPSSELADQLEALWKAATPGPWFYNTYSTVFSAPLTAALEDEAVETYETDPAVCRVPAKYGDTAPLGTRQCADARLIVALVNALPEILTALRRTR